MLFFIAEHKYTLISWEGLAGVFTGLESVGRDFCCSVPPCLKNLCAAENERNVLSRLALLLPLFTAAKSVKQKWNSLKLSFFSSFFFLTFNTFLFLSKELLMPNIIPAQVLPSTFRANWHFWQCLFLQLFLSIATACKIFQEGRRWSGVHTHSCVYFRMS